jgi:hypothetical protein
MSAEQQFVSELAARTAQYYLAMNDTCLRLDELALYEKWEEHMASLVEEVFAEHFGPDFVTLLNRCLRCT